MTAHTGPLAGLRVIEIGSLGPGPFCAMLLADLGADVVRIDRAAGASLVGPNADFRAEVLNRGRRSIGVDLKNPHGPEVVLALVENADALIEGFRPGVAERLGIGPEICRERNPRLVYSRVTGFGQDGPLAQQAGHDLNYVAQSGVLSLIGRRGQPPTPPLSLVGDFGGGMLFALGTLAAIWEARGSGQGQVVDGSMTDAAAILAAPFVGFVHSGTWHAERGTNIVDSGAPFYDVYETADGRWIAVAAMEQRFYDQLLAVFELDPAAIPDRSDEGNWPALKRIFADVVRTRTRDEWVAAAHGRDACLSAVLDMVEAPSDPHNRARGTFIDVDGLVQPAPAPRFSRTPAAVDGPPPLPGEHTIAALHDWGIDEDRIRRWADAGAFGSEAGGAGSRATAHATRRGEDR